MRWWAIKEIIPCWPLAATCPGAHTHMYPYTHMHIHKHKERMRCLGHGPPGGDRIELWITLSNLMLGPSLVTWQLYSQGQISKHLRSSGLCLFVCLPIYHKLGRKNLNWGITLLDWTMGTFLSNGSVLEGPFHCRRCYSWANGPRMCNKASWESRGEQASKAALLHDPCFSSCIGFP